jgi:hypothetical protein
MTKVLIGYTPKYEEIACFPSWLTNSPETAEGIHRFDPNEGRDADIPVSGRRGSWQQRTPIVVGASGQPGVKESAWIVRPPVPLRKARRRIGVSDGWRTSARKVRHDSVAPGGVAHAV